MYLFFFLRVARVWVSFFVLGADGAREWVSAPSRSGFAARLGRFGLQLLLRLGWVAGPHVERGMVWYVGTVGVDSTCGLVCVGRYPDLLVQFDSTVCMHISPSPLYTAANYIKTPTMVCM
jgi:hypothetical protein